MIFKDDSQHHKPHVHVYYNEYEASVGIDGELIAGSMPVKQLKRRCFNIGIGDIIVDIHSNTLLTLMARFYRKVFRGLHYSKLHIVRFRVLQAMPEQA